MDRQRIDKWLWHSRLVRTRRAAAALAASGGVRVNGMRVTTASRKVGPGDVLTIAFERVRILKILGLSLRRGSPDAARRLYEDVAPLREGPVTPALPRRPRGAGRPTKRDRRVIDRIMGRKGS